MLMTMRKTLMFSGLPETSLNRLVQNSLLITLEKGEVLFHEGAEAAGFYIVHSGAINVHRLTAEGREQVICVFYPGESFGEVALAEGQSYPASAEAIDRSQVILVRRTVFRQEIRSDPDLALRILTSMSLHLRFLVETIEDLKLKQAESRVAQWLLRNAAAGGSEASDGAVVTLPLAKRLLASQLGITAETFSRVFARWRQEAVVTVDGRLIRLEDTASLRRYIDG